MAEANRVEVASRFSMWAIRHDMFAKIDKVSLVDMAMLPPRNDPARVQQYEVSNGVAIIPVDGVLEPSESWYMYLFGGTAFSTLQEQMRAALADTNVKTILLNINSPGGTVDGTAETAQLIRELDQIKPVIAFGSGSVDSAAYWIASAARKIIVTPTTDVGSIGVVTKHVDQSGFEEQMGVKVTEITSGKYKRAASEHAPLDKEGRAYLQEQIDSLHRIFVESALIQGRGLNDEKAAELSDGRTYLGSEAQRVGLVDDVDFFDNVLASMQGKNSPKHNGGGYYMSTVAKQEQQETPVIATVADLEANHGVLVTAVREQAVKDAQTAERARIKQIRDIAPADCGALVEQAIEQGLSVEQAAIQFCTAVKAAQGKTLAALTEEAPEAVKTEQVTEVEESDPWTTALAAAVEEHNKQADAKAGR